MEQAATLQLNFCLAVFGKSPSPYQRVFSFISGRPDKSLDHGAVKIRILGLKGIGITAPPPDSSKQSRGIQNEDSIQQTHNNKKGTGGCTGLPHP
jgi:hypothetical protein